MGSSKKNQKGLKAKEIFKKFESGMNELLKADTEFWTAARIISGEMIEEYSEEVIGNNIEGIRALPEQNAMMAANLLCSEMGLMHTTITDNEGKSFPMKYERVFRQ